MKTIAYRQRRFFIAPVILIAIAVFSVITMLLWNALMPLIFHLPVITFWQAAGLLILARLFFGGGRPHSNWSGNNWRNSLRKKVEKMSPEEREEFFKKLHRIRHGWHEEHFDEKKSETEYNKSED